MGLWRGQLLASYLLLAPRTLISTRYSGAEAELDPRKLQGCCGAALARGTAQGVCGEGTLQQGPSAPGFIWV